MMRVTMLETIPGTCDAQELMAGAVVDINERTALFLVSEGQAEPYPKPEPRTAESAPARNAARTTKPLPRKGA